MKYTCRADVERLIGEGAVKTVKKPSQMKKRLLTTQPPVFLQKEGFEKINERMDNEIVRDISIDDAKCVVPEEKYETIYDYKTTSYQNDDDTAKINSSSKNIIYTVANNKPSDITYFMMNESPANGACKIETQMSNHSLIFRANSNSSLYRKDNT